MVQYPFKDFFNVTAADILKANKGVAPGFELLRVLLAMAILVCHMYEICYGVPRSYLAWVRPFRLILLPMFFCLSGFLITGSALRVKSLKVFMTFRLLRILPALLVEVTLSAIVLGAILTDYPLLDYYTHKGFYTYFGNIIGLIQFQLPGVFMTNPLHTVNRNLWTLVPEYYCYGIMAAMMLLGIFYRRNVYLAMVVIAGVAFLLWFPAASLGSIRLLHAPALIFCCLFGSLTFVYAEYIPIHWTFFLASLGLAYLGFYFLPLVPLAILATTYCTIYLGMIHHAKRHQQ